MKRGENEHGTQPPFPPNPHPPQTNCVPLTVPSTPPSTAAGLPILVIALLGIAMTSLLLVVYYVFFIKCCFNWNRYDDILGRFSISQARRQEDPIIVYAPAAVSRGLDEALISAIPIIQFKKGGDSRENEEMMSLVDCAVCLNEFQEDEKLRMLPNCKHAFHIDCIDVWLQNNANCPLCRSSISNTTQIPNDEISSPTSSSQDSTPIDEDSVVIDLRDERDEQSAGQTSHRSRGTEDSGELSMESIGHSWKKLEQRLVQKKARKLQHMSSMGDECIHVRRKDDQFSTQPIRRSFSMDSSADWQLNLSIQEIIEQNKNLNEVSAGEGCSSRARRSFFSFGQSRRSRSAVLPIQIEP